MMQRVTLRLVRAQQGADQLEGDSGGGGDRTVGEDRIGAILGGVEVDAP